MANQIMLQNYSPKDTFGFMKNNPDLEWISDEEYTNITGMPSYKKYGTADAWRNMSLTAMSEAEYVDNFNYVPNKFIHQVKKSESTWDIINGILNNKNSGSILSFDTETFGAWGESSIDLENRLSGITEIGFEVKQYGRGRRISTESPTSSFIFGLDEEQEEWGRSIVKKIKKGEELTSAESVFADRLSRHSTINHNGNVFRHGQVNYAGRDLQVVTSLNEARPNSSADIESGIDALVNIFKQQNRDEDMAFVLNKMTEFGNGNNRAYLGFNLGFDINVINRYNKMHGLNINNLENISEGNVADVYNVLKGYESVTGISVTEQLSKASEKGLITNFNRRSLDNLEAVQEVLGEMYFKDVAHMAFADARGTILAVESNKLNIADKAFEIINNGKEDTLSANDYVLINRAGNIRSHDILSINGKPVTSYQTTNQFWQYQGVSNVHIDEVKEGDKTVREAEDRLVAKFSSATDSDTYLYKSFTSEDDFNEWLKNSTEIRHKVTKKELLDRKELRDNDLVRREIDSMFQPNATSMYKQGKEYIDAGGYETFKNYYNGINTLKENNIDIQDTDALKKALPELIEKDDSIKKLFYPRQKMTGAEALAYRPDQVTKIQGIAKAFEDNQEFFNQLAIGLENSNGNNLQKTIVMKSIADQYYETAKGIGLTKKVDIFHTVEDMSNVSFNGSLIDTSNQTNATHQIMMAFRGKGLSRGQQAKNMLESLSSLEGVLSPEQIAEIRKRNAISSKPFAVASDIAGVLHRDTESIRKMSLDSYNRIQSMIQEGADVDDIYKEVKGRKISKRTIEKIVAKDTASLSESSVSKFAGPFAGKTSQEAYKEITQKAFGQDINQVARERIQSITNNIVIGQNSREMTKNLIKQGYDLSSIDSFLKFFDEGKGTNLTKLSNKYGVDIASIYFSTEGKQADYIFLTDRKNEIKLLETLNNIKKGAKPSEIEEAVADMSVGFKIPYIEKVKLGELYGETDAVYRALGKVPSVAIAKQGDYNYGRFATMSLNFYTTTGENGETILNGGITDAGGELITSIRRKADKAISYLSEGKYREGTKTIISVNNSLLSNAPNAMEGGFIDPATGKIIKQHKMTIGDISRAGVFSMSSNSGTEYNEQFKTIFNTLYRQDVESGTITPVRKAIEKLFVPFYENYGVGFTDGNTLKASIESYNKIMDSEPWKLFMSEFMTSQTGGIGRSVEGTAANLGKYGNKSMIQIMSEMLENINDENIYSYTKNKETHFPLREAFKKLAIADEEGLLDSIVSETLSEKNSFYFKGYSPQNFSNNQTGSPIRPTYVQKMNVRPYTLEEITTKGGKALDIDKLEKESQIKFRRLYAPEQEIKGQMILDEIAGRTTEATRTRTGFIGTVKSLSDAEVQRNIVLGEDEIKRRIAEAGLDQDVADVYAQEIKKRINLYEGKGYIRSSVANVEYLQRQDPKVIKLPEYKRLFEEGTLEEQRTAAYIANELNDKALKKGQVLGTLDGRRIVYNGPETIFSSEVAEGLRLNGRIAIMPETRQASDIKIQMGLEKATAEHLDYDKFVERMLKLDGVSEKDRAVAFQIATFDYDKHAQYTDIIEDVFFGDENQYRTTMLLNNNVQKHLSDTSIENKWSILFNEYADAGKTDTLVNYLNKEAGEDIFEVINGEVAFKRATSNNTANFIDMIYDKMLAGNPGDIGAETEINKRVLERFAYYESNNMAMGNIQRQFMNIYEGEEFKMDTRFFQTLLTQGEGNYTDPRTNPNLRYAEILRNNILEGTYDKQIDGIGNKTYDTARRRLITSRRGILSPKNEVDTFLGIQESLGALTGKIDLSNKNILELNLDDLFQNLPKSGTDTLGYSDFIFKKDGQLTDFLINRMKFQGLNPDNPSNVLKIDLSKYEGLEYVLGGYGKNQRKIEGIKELYIPIQNLSTSEGELYISESARKTTRFLNILNESNMQDASDPKTIARINSALGDLVNSFKEELDVLDKNSMAARLMFKMPLPNSTAGLAIDAVTPYTMPLAQEEMEDINHILRSEAESGKITSDTINKATKIYERRTNEVLKEASAIFDKDHNINFSKLHLTADDAYKHLVISDTNPKVFQNAIVMGEDMFESAGLDTGHVGLQVFKDYFHKNNKGRLVKGLTSFDNFDFVTRKEYKISKDIFEDIANSLTREVENEFSGNEQIDNWVHNMRIALDDAMSSKNYQNELFSTIINGRKVYTGGNTNVKVPGIFELFDDFGSELRKGNLSETERLLHESELNKLISAVNRVFEPLGKDYLSRVGVLGDTARYPFFHEGAIVGIRAFYDASLNGRGIRFLGPQFSILQNLDFDGDNEFIRLFGNGGLGKRGTEEYKALRERFEKGNALNNDIIYNFLTGKGGKETPDYLKSYMYGDEKIFKYSLLKDMNSEMFEKAESDFISSLDEEARKSLDNAGSDIKMILMAHSKQFGKAFKEYDKKFGNAMSNPDVIRAAIRARMGKEFIGNYSKPNLDIRDTMTYLLSRTGKEYGDNAINFSELKNIVSTISYINGGDGPQGILTWLEQQGIDTKHVHDAKYLNTSESWRTGITKLFNNSLYSGQYSEEKQLDALTKMVTGSRKVLFKDVSMTDLDLAKLIAETNLNDYTLNNNGLIKALGSNLEGLGEEESKELLFKMKSLRGIYDLSNFGNENINAYIGYNGTTKKAKQRALDEMLDAMNLDSNGFRKALISGKDFDSMINQLTNVWAKTSSTDDILKINNKAINVGDIISYFDYRNDDITHLVYRGTENKISTFQAYDVKKRKFLEGEENIFTFKGTNKEVNDQLGRGWIKTDDLNNAVKNNPRKKIPDRYFELISDAFNEETSSLYNINDIETKSLISNTKITGRKIEENAYNQLINRRLNTIFNKANDFNLSDEAFIKVFNEASVSKNKYVNESMSNIVGSEALAFRAKAQKIYSQIAMAEDSDLVLRKGVNRDSLIKEINKDIASKGRKSNISRFDNIDTYLGENASTYADTNSAIYENIVKGENINYGKISKEATESINEHEIRIKQALDDFEGNIIGLGKDDIENNKFIKENYDKLISTRKESADMLVSNLSKILDKDANGRSEDLLKFLNWNEGMLKTGINYTVNENMKIGFGEYAGKSLSEFSEKQINEIYHDLNSLSKDAIIGLDNSQRMLYNTTVNLLRNAKKDRIGRNAEGLSDYVSSNFEEFKETEIKKQQALQDSLERSVDTVTNQQKKEAAKAFEEALDNAKKEKIERKTLKDAFKEMNDVTKKRLKIGLGVVGGLALFGGITHSMRNTHDNGNPNVPTLNKSDTNYDVETISDTNDLKYPNEPSQAEQVKAYRERQERQQAPKSPKTSKKRTIYNDPNSGLKFKVSGSTYNKLSHQAYERLSNAYGATDAKLNVSQDRSTITDNWLQNKFAELTE